MPISPEAKKLRARLAANRRWNPGLDTTQDQRELKVLIAEGYLRDLIAAGPSLTDDQRERLAALLRPGQSEEL
jgi:hypothetical protein